MGVDIKSLRIGSHILVDGVRARVSEIINPPLERVMPGIGLLHFNAVIDGNVCECGCPACADGVEPIAITPELLKELGFEDDKTDIVKRVGGYFIFFHQINNLRWRVSLEEENCTNYGNTLCRYLHEAEAFLALHGIELIPD